MRRIIHLVDPVVDKAAEHLQLQTLLLAAEAARLEGRHARAVRILATARGLHQSDRRVLNNLVYTLAQEPKTLADAEAMVPALLAAEEPSGVTLDTVATVYLRRGKLPEAERYMKQALEKLAGSGQATFEVRVNAAEIHSRSGRHAAALQMLDAVRRDPACPPATDTRARILQEEIRQAVDAQGKEKGK
jgi:uncharacterized membrane-anchored protein YjiN (DUF445 family)